MRTNEEIVSIIEKRTEEQGLSLSELARRVGMAKSAISRFFNRTREFPLNKVNDFSRVLDLKPEYILGFEEETDINHIYNQLEKPRKKKVYKFAKRQLSEQNNKAVPLVGATAANPQVLSYADPKYDTTVNASVPDCADCALVIHGDSMEPEYKDGSIVFYKRQESVENGELAIVDIDGDGVTFKKVIFDYDNQQVILRSLNKKYEDRVLKDEEYKIVGKVVK